MDDKLVILKGIFSLAYNIYHGNQRLTKLCNKAAYSLTKLEKLKVASSKSAAAYKAKLSAGEKSLLSIVSLWAALVAMPPIREAE